MKRIPRAVILGAFVGLAAAAPAGSQTAGAIEGRVIGPDGTPLPGARMEARSQNLPGVRTATSASDGHYLLAALPPGTYTTRATLKGYTTVESTNRVALNAVVTVDATLQPSAKEEVVVSAAAPEISLRSAETGTTYPLSVLRRTPLTRNYADVLRLQPGVIPDTAATQGGRAVPLSIYGATSIENLYLIDGADANDIKQSFQGTTLSPESIEEVEIKTGGYSAEYGHAIGGIINAVTRAGGNELRGDVFGFYNSRSMRAASKVNPEEDLQAGEQTDIDRWDGGVALGGFILKDRLWFFGSYDRIGQTTDRTPVEGILGGETFPFNAETNVYTGKLTWNARPATSVVAYAFGDPEQRSGATGTLNSTDPLTYTANRTLGSKSYGIRIDQILGAAGMAEVQYFRRDDGFQTSIPPEANSPLVTDLTVPGLTANSGGFGNISGPTNNQQSRRDSVVGSFTGYFGGHQVKVGGVYEYDVTSAMSLLSGGASLQIRPCKAIPDNPESVDRCAQAGGAGVPFTNFQGHDVPGGVFYTHSYFVDASGSFLTQIFGETPIHAWSAYAQDTWRLSPRLTLDLGMRWEREKISNWKGEPRIDLQNEWSPRLGIVWDFTGGGTSKAFASAGRFYYRYPTDLNAYAFRRSDYFFNNTVNYDASSLSNDPLAPQRFFFSAPPAGDEPVDKGVKGMYQDELTIGVEKALDPTFVIGVKGSYQSLGRVIEDRCDLDYTSPLTGYNACAIINPGSSEPFATGTLPCYNGSRRPPDAALYPGPADDALCNENGGPAVPRATRIYRGIELTARKSMTDRLWVQAWYVFSSLRGNYDGAANLRSGQTQPGLNADFDYWQFNRANSSGKLYLDRPHQFRLTATYSAPFGLVAGLTGYVRSGAPRDELLFFNDFYGGQLYAVPRGSAGRIPTEYEVSLSLAWEFRIGVVSVTPRVYVYNLLNHQGAVSVNDDFNPNGAFDARGNDIQDVDYGKILARQDPRLLRVGVRISF